MATPREVAKSALDGPYRGKALAGLFNYTSAEFTRNMGEDLLMFCWTVGWYTMKDTSVIQGQIPETDPMYQWIEKMSRIDKTQVFYDSIYRPLFLLAVASHILNTPGKTTPAQWEKDIQQSDTQAPFIPENLPDILGGRIVDLINIYCFAQISKFELSPEQLTKLNRLNENASQHFQLLVQFFKPKPTYDRLEQIFKEISQATGFTEAFDINNYLVDLINDLIAQYNRIDVFINIEKPTHNLFYEQDFLTQLCQANLTYLIKTLYPKPEDSPATISAKIGPLPPSEITPKLLKEYLSSLPKRNPATALPPFVPSKTIPFKPPTSVVPQVSRPPKTAAAVKTKVTLPATVSAPIVQTVSPAIKPSTTPSAPAMKTPLTTPKSKVASSTKASATTPSSAVKTTPKPASNISTTNTAPVAAAATPSPTPAITLTIPATTAIAIALAPPIAAAVTTTPTLPAPVPVSAPIIPPTTTAPAAVSVITPTIAPAPPPPPPPAPPVPILTTAVLPVTAPAPTPPPAAAPVVPTITTAPAPAPLPPPAPAFVPVIPLAAPAVGALSPPPPPPPPPPQQAQVLCYYSWVHGYMFGSDLDKKKPITKNQKVQRVYAAIQKKTSQELQLNYHDTLLFLRDYDIIH